MSSVSIGESERRKRSVKLFTTLMRASDSFLQMSFSDDPLEDKVSPTEFAILEALYFKGCLHQSEVADKILKSRGNISIAVQRLVEKNLVHRIQDSQDRRHTVVSLTEKGRPLIAECYKRVSEGIERACAHLSDDEIAEYIRLNKKLGLGE